VTVDGMVTSVNCVTVYWCYLNQQTNVCVKNETGVVHTTKPLKQVNCP
jgi:hypothetical protein